MTLRVFERARNAEADAAVRLLNAGFLRIYEDPRDPPLVELRFESPAFAPASDGIVSARPIPEVRALRGGKPTLYRCLEADGQSIVMEDAAEAIGLTEEIYAGQPIRVAEFIYQRP